ncbi:hypothetical protein D3C78_1349760 [compost metagenome]
MTAGGDLIGNVVDLKQRRPGFGFGNESADALHAHQQPFGSQLTQSAVDGHATEAQLANQLAFRRHSIVRRPAAILDLLGNHLLDPGIQRRRPLAHLGNQRGDRRCRHGKCPCSVE